MRRLRREVRDAAYALSVLAAVPIFAPYYIGREIAHSIRRRH